MKAPQFRILLALGLSATVLAVIGALSTVLVSAWREYQHFKSREHTTLERLHTSKERADEKEEYLSRLLDTNDDAFAERIARQRLGYTRPGEILLRFE